MSQTEFYSRISCSFGSVKKVHLVIFSDVLRSSKSQNSLISGCEIGTPWYTGFRLFLNCLLVSIAIFPMKHQMKPRFSQNKNDVTKPHGQAFVLRSSSGRNKPRVAVEVLCHTRFATLQVGRLTGIALKSAGGNHEPRSFLSGDRFFLVSSNENSKLNISGF